VHIPLSTAYNSLTVLLTPLSQFPQPLTIFSFSVDYNRLADHFLRSWKDCLPERRGGGGEVRFPWGMVRCVAEFHPQYGIHNPWSTNIHLRCSERRCWRFKSSEIFRCLDWEIVAEDLLGHLHESENSWSWRLRQYDVSKHWQLFTSLDSVTSLREICLMIRH